jgi:hypothetical protein
MDQNGGFGARIKLEKGRAGEQVGISSLASTSGFGKKPSTISVHLS